MDVLVRQVVQYAGALALNEVERAKVAQALQIDPTMGLIALSPDETTVALDLSSVLWKDVLAEGL